MVLITLLRYCRSLKFSQAPDYDYLINIFRGCLARLNLREDGIYDWSPKDTIPIENKDIGGKRNPLSSPKDPENNKTKVYCFGNFSLSTQMNYRN